MSITDKLSYYADKLIAQYRNGSKARGQIMIMGLEVMASDLASQMGPAFDLDDAVGAQLDIIGAYVGVGRNVGPGTANAFFGLWTYASTFLQANYQGTWNPVTNTPALPSPTGLTGKWYAIQVGGTASVPPAVAFLPGDIVWSNGAAWQKATTDNANGLTTYADFTVNANAQFYSYGTAGTNVSALTDADYRQVIKFQIIRNASDNTLASIVSAINTIFPGYIRVVDNLNMTLSYYVSTAFPISPGLLTQFLPKPMGVGINVTLVAPASSGFLLTESGSVLTTEGGDGILF